MKILLRTFLGLLLICTLGCKASKNLEERSYIERLGLDVCDCFSQVPESKRVEKTLEECIAINGPKYEKEIERLTKIDSSSTYQDGYFVGFRAGKDLVLSLVKDCDALELFFQKLRYDPMVSLKAKFTKQYIESLDFLIRSSPNSINQIWERGTINFVFNQLDEAEMTFKRCLEINPDHSKSIFFLGWINERRGDFAEALRLYQKVRDLTGEDMFDILIEIMKKKLK